MQRSDRPRPGTDPAMQASAGDDYVIRPAEPRDREAVARELAAYLTHIGEALDATGLDHDIVHWESDYGGASGVLLVVESAAGEIVGTVGLRSLEPGVGEIKRMWIRPAWQGIGLGRRLFMRCVDHARALGFRVLRLDTEQTMAAALHLYRAAGFREISDYNGNPRAQIWMELKL